MPSSKGFSCEIQSMIHKFKSTPNIENGNLKLEHIFENLFCSFL